eukprot:3155570-Alexandrium_andersonii.AAC.1
MSTEVACRRPILHRDQGYAIHNHEAAIAERGHALAGSCHAQPLALLLLSKFLSLCLGVERERERGRHCGIRPTGVLPRSPRQC